MGEEPEEERTRKDKGAGTVCVCVSVKQMWGHTASTPALEKQRQVDL